MFLTQKDLAKCRAYTVVMLMLAALVFLLGYKNGEEWLYGVASFALLTSFVSIWLGKVSRGVSPLFNVGTKLVNKELKPAEFIARYEAKRREQLVVCKPDYQLMSLVVSAYLMNDQDEKAIETLEELIRVSDEKTQNRAKLFMAAVWYDQGRVEEADNLFNEVTGAKLDVLTRTMADTVMKNSRAIAKGDFSVAEAYARHALEHKNQPAVMLCVHFDLATIFMKTGREEEALREYEICAQIGGQTKYQRIAAEHLAENGKNA